MIPLNNGQAVAGIPCYIPNCTLAAPRFLYTFNPCGTLSPSSYHQPSCYDLEPCARESKIYGDQIETRELFYDCLLNLIEHVRNVRLTCGLYFFWIQHFYSATSKLVLRRKGLQRTQCLGHIYGRKEYGCGLYVSNIVYCGWITYQRSIVTAIWSLGSLCL